MRAQRQQFGVRVGRLGPINVRSQGSKRWTDLRQRRTAPHIVFHHPGCLQGAAMAINVKKRELRTNADLGLASAATKRSGSKSISSLGVSHPCGMKVSEG